MSEYKNIPGNKENSNHEDIRLLNEVAKGDGNSLAVIYDKYQQLIYSLILRITGNDVDAGELMLDVFMEVRKKAALFNNDSGSFRAWLVTLAHNRSIALLRSDRKKKALLQTKRDIPQNPPFENISNAEFTVLYLSYFEGYRESEIGEMLSEPIQNIRANMRQGMMKLQKEQ